MTDTQRELYNYQRAQSKARAERKKDVKKLKGLDTVSSKRRRTEKMNRELAKKKVWLWDETAEGVLLCRLCDEPIEEFSDADICHESSRGLGGGKRDDGKVFLGHRLGNRAQGSQSLEAYKLGKTPEQLRKLCGVSQ